MDTIVLKFGGSSVADNEKLKIVAEKIIGLYNKKNNIVFQFDGIRKPKQNNVDIREFSALISEIQFY